MNLDDLQEHFDKPNLNLTILMEECSELIKQCAKIKRFGEDELSLKKLQQEISDVLALIGLAVKDYELNQEEIEEGIYAKYEKMRDWYD